MALNPSSKPPTSPCAAAEPRPWVRRRHELCPEAGAATHQRVSGAGRAERVPRASYLEFGAYDSAVPCGRLHTRNVLNEWGLAAVTEDAELIVSELLTNAIKVTAARGLDQCVALRVAARDDHLLIEVWDPVAAPPEPRPHAVDADSGRGLEIVSLLSERWGTYHVDRGGKVVWAVVALRPRIG